MNADLLKQYAAQALAMQPYPNPNFPPSPYYRFFEILARNTQPSLSVVLGVCGGGDCLHLARGCHNGQVIGIDITNDYPANIKYIQDKYPNFKFRLGDSVGLAQSIRLQYGQIDILFIDTIHEEQKTWEEFNAWQPYLSDNALVCFDDLLRIEMGNFWDDLQGNKVRLDMLHATAEGGFGVWWTSQS